MNRSVSDTRDVSLFDRTGLVKGASEGPLWPHLRVLYHVDLARIGACSHPELELAGGAWQVVGRRHPLFVTAAPGDRWRSLDDPTISREQLRVRWCEADACFEVEPIAGSRRELYSVDPRVPRERREIHGRVRLESGSCVAVGDRLLLGLEVLQRPHGPEEDRLGMVGESPALWHIREEIREIAAFRRPVLILGPTGTGKELVAGAIHRCSVGSRGPLQTLNCAALPDHLVESLLFGHVRGAFTGAESSQTGVFVAADGGTLFLDELGEMPLGVQPKLLRALQDGVVTPIGSHRGVKVAVRLIAATNRDPERELAAGRLRDDLYHRVATHVLRVPSLAARRLDIPSLFLHFLERSRVDHPALAWLWQGGADWRVTVPMSFFVDLIAGDWPGNVRELENAAERVARRNLRGPPFTTPGAPQPSPTVAPGPPHADVDAGPARASEGPAPPDDVAATRVERLRVAGRLLGIAPKTVGKLLTGAALAEAWIAGDDGVADRLEACAREALHSRLAAHGFEQGRLARELGASPWTLIRLMQRFGLARPTELSREQIARALAAAGGDLARAARSLEVSEHGLKRRLAELDRSG